LTTSCASGAPPQFYLRQFRCIEDCLKADPQQITSSTITLKRIEIERLRSAFTFELQHLDSHPLAAELGIENQSTQLAFEMSMDFRARAGAVLWHA